MTVQDLLEILNDVPDKSIPVILPIEVGFISACNCDTVQFADAEGQEVFAIMPCYCHQLPEEIVVDVLADDFDEISKN